MSELPNKDAAKDAAKATPAPEEAASKKKEASATPLRNLGQISVPLKNDIGKIFEESKTVPPRVKMEGFPEWSDPIAYIVGSTYEIWDEKGMGRIYDYYKNNALVHTSDGVTYGRDQVIANSISKLAGYPDLRDFLDEVIWAPDGNGAFHTSMRWTWTATNTGHTIYGPPTGKQVAVWGIANCYIKNNRVVEEWVTYNEISLIRQLGYSLEDVLDETANKGAQAVGNTGTHGPAERLNGQLPPKPFGANNGRYSDIEYFVRKHYYDTYNIRLFNGFYDNYAASYLYHGPSDREFFGIGDFIQDQLNLYQAFPDLALYVEDFYYMYDEERDEYRTATRWNIIGTHTGFGIYGPGTGAHVVISGISQHTIKDGKFIEEWSMYDELALMRKIRKQRDANAAKEQKAAPAPAEAEGDL